MAPEQLRGALPPRVQTTQVPVGYLTLLWHIANAFEAWRQAQGLSRAAGLRVAIEELLAREGA